MEQKVKKIEIIIDYLEKSHLINQLEKGGINNYTVIKEAQGSGNRGLRLGEGLSGEFSNSYIIIACKEEEVQKIIEIVNPWLKKFGGMMLVSDAMMIEH